MDNNRADGKSRDRPSLVVCRGCCCGTERALPDIDHERWLEELRELCDGVADIRTTGCLGPCAEANIMVVRPSATGRSQGGRPVWLGWLNDSRALADVASWLKDGGPGVEPMPPMMTLYMFKPSLRGKTVTGQGASE